MPARNGAGAAWTMAIAASLLSPQLRLLKQTLDPQGKFSHPLWSRYLRVRALRSGNRTRGFGGTRGAGGGR